MAGTAARNVTGVAASARERVRNPQGRSNGIALGLAVVPGLLGLFGLGHLYAGRRRDGFRCMAMSAVLYALLPVSIVLAFPWLVLSVLWFAGWTYQIWDLRTRGRSPVAG